MTFLTAKCRGGTYKKTAGLFNSGCENCVPCLVGSTKVGCALANEGTCVGWSTPTVVKVTGTGQESGGTPGKEILDIYGKFYGTVRSGSDAKDIIVRYGKVGVLEYTALDCRVVAPDPGLLALNTPTVLGQIRCLTAPGSGTGHSLTVTIGDGSIDASNARTSTVFAAKINYAAPIVANYKGAGSVDASTLGGQELYVSGANFGPLLTVVEDAEYGGDLLNKYYITKVNENCGISDKVIRSQSECIEALKFVGKSGQIMWSSQNTGIPGGCSVRDPDDGHFDTRGIQGTVGGKRSDLAAVCKTNAQLKSTCIVSIPHTQLKCQTSAGAGKGLKMVVTIGKLCTYFGFYLWLFGFVSWFLILLFLRHTHAHTTFYFIGGQKSTIPAISYGVPTLKTTTCGTTHGAINSGEPQCACGSSDLKTTKNPPLTCPHVNKKIPVITIGNLKCWHRSDKVNPCIALTNPLGLPTPIVGDVDSSTRLSTKGYQLIMLSGFNFGRTSDLESVTYGPFTGTEVSMNIVADGTSLEKSKGGCKIHEPSFSILCNTLPGIAGPHNWIVTVKGQVSQQLIKTRYASPIVSSVSPAQFPTSGNTKVVITGEEFGTADSAASFQVVFTNGGPVNHCKDSTGTLCKTIEATRMPTLAGNCVFVFGCFVEIL